VLDCTDAIELLVDLFISEDNAPLLRISVLECIRCDAVRHISTETLRKCICKIESAIQKTGDSDNLGELEELCEALRSLGKVDYEH